MDLAWGLLHHGRPAEALPLMLRATRLAPWEAHCAELYAAVLVALHQCAAGLKMEQHAVDLLSPHAKQTVRAAFEKRRAELVRTCTSAPPAAAP
jgi:hypothetical protein